MATKKTAKARNYTAFAMINGNRQKVKISAVSLEQARASFAEQYPGSPVPDLK